MRKEKEGRGKRVLLWIRRTSIIVNLSYIFPNCKLHLLYYNIKLCKILNKETLCQQYCQQTLIRHITLVTSTSYSSRYLLRHCHHTSTHCTASTWLHSSRHPANTPPQAGIRPFSRTNFSCLIRGSPLVKMSATFSSDGTYETKTVPSETLSLIKCTWMSICLDLAWNWKSLVRLMAAWLSQNIGVEPCCGKPKCCRYAEWAGHDDGSRNDEAVTRLWRV